MKKDSIRFFASCMIIMTTLTGCGTSKTIMMPYNKTASVQSQTPVLESSDTNLDFISANLCIVPQGEDIGDDNTITGISSLLFNIKNQEVVYADNVYEKIYPASLTKLMTALVVLEEANLNDTVVVSHNAANILEPGAKLCGLKEGDQIRLGDLLTALLVYSGNDAGIAIAEHVSGSEEAFCNKMNEMAASLGAVDSHFTNSHGLHQEEHYTTAYDLYLIFNALMEHAEVMDIIKTSSYVMKYTDVEGNSKEHKYTNTNRYLKNEIKAPDGVTVVGGKTGTTNAAGYCLELYVEDSKQDGYIGMVLKAPNSDSLYQQMNTLLSKIK